MKVDEQPNPSPVKIDEQLNPSPVKVDEQLNPSPVKVDEQLDPSPVKVDDVDDGVEGEEEEHGHVLAVTQLNQSAAMHPGHGLPNHPDTTRIYCIIICYAFLLPESVRQPYDKE